MARRPPDGAVAARSTREGVGLANILWIRLALRPGFAEFTQMEKLSGAPSNFFNVIDPYTMALGQCRHFVEASARAEHLIAADPLNPNAYLAKVMTLIHTRRYPEAEQLARQTIALGPQLIWPRAFHAFSLMQMGRLEEAKAEFTALGGTGPWLQWAAVLAVRQGRQADADRLVAIMRQSMGDGANYQYAGVYAQEDRKDDAMAALERAAAVLDSGLAFHQFDVMFDPLRSDSRFQALIRRLNFPN